MSTNDYSLTSEQLVHPWQSYGYWNLGPVRIPPTPPAVGMTDRAGTGEVWWLFWDGENHMLLSDTLPPALTNTYIFGPWDGPHLGCTGWRLGVTTAYPGSGLLPPGTPHLQFDFPGAIGQNRSFPESAKPLTLPDFFSPLLWSVPQPSNWPAPQPGVIPGIPSTAPVPTNGGAGLSAFYAAFDTNAPILVTSSQVATSQFVPLAPHLAHGDPA
jgi:hypothetical protein